MKNFKDVVFYDNADEKIICYRTGLTVYEEKFANGMLVSLGFNGAGFMLNVLDGMPTYLNAGEFGRPQSFDFCAGGYQLNGTWEWKGFIRTETELENGTPVLITKIILRSNLQPVEAEIETLLDGTAVFARTVKIKNISDDTVAVSDVTVLGGGMEILDNDTVYPGRDRAEDIYDIGYCLTDQWGHEGSFGWKKLPVSGFSVDGRFMADRHRHPGFFLRNNRTGGMHFGQLAWSGGYSLRFNLRAEIGRCHLSYEMKTDGTSPFVVLEAGEEYTLPTAHLGYVTSGLDDAVNEMHSHIRKSVFTLPDARGLYGLVEGGMGPERIMDLTAVKHYVDTLAEVGAETMIVDAGWYCPAGTEIHEWHRRMGDWYPAADKHSEDMREVRDYIHSKGLLFGLWLDIESLGHDSKMYKEHPDWTLVTRFGKSTTILDFTRPEIAQWAENQLSRVITDYKIDLFRLDNNITSFELYSNVGEGKLRQCASARYFEAVYKMYDNLRRKFPDVVFENCAGGGGRSDLGLVKYFTHTWVTDWQIPPRSVAITNGISMFLPPEVIDRLASGMNSHKTGDLSFIMRNTIMCRPTVNDFNAVGTGFNTQQIEFVKHTLDIYKKYIRPWAKDGKIYHHTPVCSDEMPVGTMILERASAEGDRGVIGVFSLSGKREEDTVTVYPRGIRPEGKYEVTLDNSGATAVINGFSLVNDGIRCRLSQALSSELIVIIRI